MHPDYVGTEVCKLVMMNDYIPTHLALVDSERLLIVTISDREGKVKFDGYDVEISRGFQEIGDVLAAFADDIDLDDELAIAPVTPAALEGMKKAFEYTDDPPAIKIRGPDGTYQLRVYDDLVRLGPNRKGSQTWRN